MDKVPSYIEYYEELIMEGDDVHTVMIEIPKFPELMEFINSIPEEILYEPNDPKYGRTHNPHITVLYGIDKMEGEKARSILRKIPSAITATLGSVTKFETPEFDVIKIDVSSPYLYRVNKFLRDNVEYHNDYDTFHPHVTVAYVKKGEGSQFLKDNRFAGKRFAFRAFLYSNENWDKEVIPMKVSKPKAVDEVALGLGGGYGGSPGGQIAASGWAATYSSPQSSTRLGNYKTQSGGFPKQTTRDKGTGNTVTGIDPYDTVTDEDLKDPRFSADEIRSGLRYEMAQMEYPNKDIARQIVIQRLKKNPKQYSDLHQYFDTEK